VSTAALSLDPEKNGEDRNATGHNQNPIKLTEMEWVKRHQRAFKLTS
jgi:hypothetical protein